MAAPHRLAGGRKSRLPVSRAPREIDKDAFWTTPMDILIPAALEGQITRERAGEADLQTGAGRGQRPNLSGSGRRAGRARRDRGAGRYSATPAG